MAFEEDKSRKRTMRYTEESPTSKHAEGPLKQGEIVTALATGILIINVIIGSASASETYLQHPRCAPTLGDSASENSSFRRAPPLSPQSKSSFNCSLLTSPESVLASTSSWRSFPRFPGSASSSGPRSLFDIGTNR